MKGLASKKDDLFSTGSWKYLLVEWVFSLLTPMPWFWNTTFKEKLIDFDDKYNEVSINNVFQVIMFLRVYIIVRFLLS